MINDFIRKLQWNLVFKRNTFSNRNRFGIKKSQQWVKSNLISPHIKNICDKIYNSCFQILKNQFYFP